MVGVAVAVDVAHTILAGAAPVAEEDAQIGVIDIAIAIEVAADQDGELDDGGAAGQAVAAGQRGGVASVEYLTIERESGLGVFYYEYDELHRLAYEGQFVDASRQYENYYEYGAAGNRTLLRHGETDAENLTYYEYDGANELTQLHDKDGWTYFAYDANGNTVKEQTPAYTRYFDWDGRDMLAGVRSTEDGWTDNE